VEKIAHCRKEIVMLGKLFGSPNLRMKLLPARVILTPVSSAVLILKIL
jgi:hypothetical protein